MRLEALGPTSLSKRGACKHCGEAAHTIGSKGIDAIHSTTLMFRCFNGNGTFAEVITADSLQQERQAGYDQGNADAQTGAEDAQREGISEGVAIGRREVIAEVRKAITEARAHEFGALRADEHDVYPRPVHDAIPTKYLDAIESVIDA